jgi:fructoselysine 6-kinase
MRQSQQQKKSSRNTMKIACVGDNCVDIYESNGQVSAGGNGFNLAVAIKRSGVDCSYFGMVGDDPNGNVILSSLQNEGVDCAGVERLQGETGWTKIRLVDGNRVFIAEELGVQRNYDISADNLRRIAAHDWIHYTAFTNWPTAFSGGIRDYDTVADRHVSYFYASKVPVSMDFSDGDMGRLLEMMRGKVHTGFFSRPGLGDKELRREAQYLMEFGFSLVVLTRGEKGSYLFDKTQEILQPAYPVTVVDTLGAGDSFMGAFLSRYVAGKPLNGCARYASWYAAQVCGRQGGI